MKIIDLSLPINKHMEGLPGVPAYKDNPTKCFPLTVISNQQTEFLETMGVSIDKKPEISNHMLSKLEITTHIGTHVDAPLHMIENTWSIDKVPLESLVKKGVIIPLTDIEPGGMLTAEMILKTGVEFDETSIPILHTGWTEKTWGTSEFWENTVYMHKDITELLIDRGVSAVAIDFFPEFPFWRNDVERPEGQPPGYNHRALFEQNIIIIQMVTNVGAIGDNDFILSAVPLKLEGLDGSPARVFAMII